jgi:hypothetical protein
MLGVFGVKMQWVLVHGQQSEPGIVGFRNGATGPMFIGITNSEILVIAAKSFLIPVLANLDHAVSHL